MGGENVPPLIRTYPVLFRKTAELRAKPLLNNFGTEICRQHNSHADGLAPPVSELRLSARQLEKRVFAIAARGSGSIALALARLSPTGTGKRHQYMLNAWFSSLRLI